MRLLSRYVIRQNVVLLTLICAIGLGIYVFVDLFDKLDDFLEAGVGLGTIVRYYTLSVPFILAQIFPAVVLLSLMAQLGLMQRNRELLALEACAVSMRSVTRAVLAYAAVLCVVQFVLSQGLGSAGHRAATRIWDEDVRKRQVAGRVLADVWFKEGARIAHMARVSPASRQGEGLTLYVLEEGNGAVREVLRARKFTSSDAGWTLRDVTRNVPETFVQEQVARMDVDLRTDVRGYLAVDPKANLESLSVWELGREIGRLRDSGSNIERLHTAWHMKLAYACSVVVMAFIALAIVSVFGSLYVIIPCGLVLTFCYYAVFVVFVSAGERGLLPPFVAAWAANAVFVAVAGSWLFSGRAFSVR